jgi:hypothetical protein
MELCPSYYNIMIECVINMSNEDHKILMSHVGTEVEGLACCGGSGLCIMCIGVKILSVIPIKKTIEVNRHLFDEIFKCMDDK